MEAREQAAEHKPKVAQTSRAQDSTTTDSQVVMLDFNFRSTRLHTQMLIVLLTVRYSYDWLCSFNSRVADFFFRHYLGTAHLT